MDPWPATEDLVRRLAADPAAVGWDLPSFVTAYSLHDSDLEEVRLDALGGLLLLIALDTVWNPQVPPAFDRLVVRLPVVYAAHWTQGAWHQNTISGATSALVNAAERERMLADGTVDLRAYSGSRDDIGPPFADDTLTRTTLECMNWSRLRLLHGGTATLLCTDAAGVATPLPKRGRTAG